MRYALIDGNMRVCDIVEMDENTTWIYPDSFQLVEAATFMPESNQEFADYIYRNYEFILDPESVELSTDIDALVTAKVNAAMAQAETRIMAETSKQISQATLQPISNKPGKLE